MKCRNCGSEIGQGCRFCEVCGTEVLPVNLDRSSINNRICPSCGSLVDEMANACSHCGYWLGGEDEEFEDDLMIAGKLKGDDTMKMILIGVGIGLLVLALIFGVIYVLGQKDDGKNNMDPTTTEAIASRGSAVGDEVSDDSDYNEAADSGTENDSDYYYYTEAELYQNHVPEFLPDSSKRYLTERDLEGLSADQIQKTINDIYARNGKIFNKDLFQNYYNNQSWYYPFSRDSDEIRAGMNDYERRNIEFMTNSIR